jgi:hypothetical protein
MDRRMKKVFDRNHETEKNNGDQQKLYRSFEFHEL